MSELKKQNVDKCFSLLKDFINEADTKGNKKGMAMLALNQLLRIKAGKSEGWSTCTDKPRAY